MIPPFEDFFADVHGHPPYPWQSRLAAQVHADGRWPAVLDLPTGAGKTATLDIAVWTLAAAAHDPARLPRRIVYVVDRRVIVDQAADRAHVIADALRTAATPAVAAVAEALQGLSGDGAPLYAAMLRGGVPRDDTWARRPDEPTIIVSTVDQVGSRLLFRGYGVSSGMRPVHAGLLGTDTLYLLDEVHLSRPFAQTLTALTTPAATGGAPAQLTVVEMSATPGAADDTPPFQLGEQDRDPVTAAPLARRMSAVKHLRTMPPLSATTPAALGRQIADVAAKVDAQTVAVVVNRVATARATAAALRDRIERRGGTLLLLTGRMRPLDRDAALHGHDRWLRDRAARDPDSPPLMVVATQSIEAGADFDFDAMVTECPSLDALQQRLGRVDRAGLLAAAGTPADVTVLTSKSAIRDDDPIYGGALTATWTYLNDADDPVDAGPEAPLWSDAPAHCRQPQTDAPLLLPQHLDAWVQTTPIPEPDPDVSRWLHGDVRTAPEVRLVWRADLTQALLHEGLADAEVAVAVIARIAAIPPSAPESLSVPLYAARAWLAAAPEAPVGDVDGISAELSRPTPAKALPAAPLPAVRWHGSDESTLIADPAAIRPGDTVVVPAGYGGLAHGNWAPEPDEQPQPVTDLATHAQWVQRRRAALRFHPATLPPDVPMLPPKGEAGEENAPRDRVERWLAAARQSDAESWVTELLDDVAAGRWSLATSAVDEDVIEVLTATRGRLNGDDGDRGHSFTGRQVTLHAHSHGVADRARDYARRLGIPDAMTADISLAGRLHDLGKADPRFQLGLHRGDRVNWAMADEPLAKSGLGGPQAGVVMRRAGYPSGMRHELASLSLIDTGALADGASDPALVRHLVATHHGHCRPFPPAQPDPDPVKITLEVDGSVVTVTSDHGLDRLDGGLGELFWAVVRRHGHLRTAWYEAILRLADHRRSEEESRGACDD